MRSDRAVAKAIACGTAVVGDISNTLATFGPLARSRLAAVVFLRADSVQSADPRGFVEHAHQKIAALMRPSVARGASRPNAPYSVSAAGVRALRHAVDRDPFSAVQRASAESVEEVEFVLTAGRALRELLEERACGIRTGRGRRSARFSTSMSAASSMGRPRRARRADDDGGSGSARRAGRHTGDLPRSNGIPAPARRRLGTSTNRASTSLWEQTAWRAAPDLNVFRRAGDAAGARAGCAGLGPPRQRRHERARGRSDFDAEYGPSSRGKRARLLAVDIPPGTVDVEDTWSAGSARTDKVDRIGNC